MPLVAAAVAYGCTAAATLNLTPAAAAPGSTITVTGKYFGDPHDQPGDPGDVQIRIGSVTGPALAAVQPVGADGVISAQITVPAGTPAGDTFITATRLEADGRPVYGTPARQAFTVLPASAGPASGATTGSGTAIARTIVTNQLATLSLATARRMARSRVRQSKPKATSIRARCNRRNRTTAVCRVRYKVGSKSGAKTLVVKSEASSASW